MRITLILIAKTSNNHIAALCEEYKRRLSHYVHFNIEILSLPKKKKFSSQEQQKEEEGRLILSKIASGDRLVLLDEKGVEYTSKSFANYIEKKQNQSLKSLVFVVGGPYGVSPELMQRANEKIAVSQMTFSHQMVRMIFVEQLYRAYTIIKGESYHH
jgi:23S rRNA (pseudouridine1915-N3)-methyltransferase